MKFYQNLSGAHSVKMGNVSEGLIIYQGHIGHK